jgi:putative hydrolase of the HAD superfamily
LALAQQLAKSGKYFMSTINNESLELNLCRIETYGLRDIFSLFVSSCFVGLRKPEDGIYRLALELTQQAAEECCFLDDRPLNLEAATRLGIHAIAVQDGAQVSAELGKLGVGV